MTAMLVEIALVAALLITANTWTLVKPGGLPTLGGALLGAWLARPTCLMQTLSFTPPTSLVICKSTHYPLLTISASMESDSDFFTGAQVALKGALYVALAVFLVTMIGLLVIGGIWRDTQSRGRYK
jgi:hypothetical protein